MKSIISTIFILLPVLVFSQNTVTVQFADLQPIQGKLYVGLYSSEGTFMQAGKHFRDCVAPVNGRTVECVLENIPDGRYAISVFHDENDNDKLDTGMFGIPTENYGFSNNARGMFGPPSFEDCTFEVKGDVVQRIKL